MPDTLIGWRNKVNYNKIVKSAVYNNSSVRSWSFTAISNYVSDAYSKLTSKPTSPSPTSKVYSGGITDFSSFLA